MGSPRFPILWALVLAASATQARAEEGDAAPAMPKPRAKITSPYVESLLGSWDARVVVPGAPEMKGTARFWLAMDGTALVDDFMVGEGDQAFHGFGVRYVLADGKTVRQWWFDSDGAGDVWPSEGPLTADGWELRSEVNGAKSVHRMKKEGEGHVFTMELGGTPQVTVHYTKAEKEHPWTPVSETRKLKHPMIDAQLGNWDVKGKYTMGGKEVEHTGTSAMRLVVGGHYLLQEYEIQSPLEHSFGYGVSTLVANDGAIRMWWFSNADEKPTIAEGPVKDTEWAAKAPDTSFGPMEMTWTRTDSGFQLKAKLERPGVEGGESYTRRP